MWLLILAAWLVFAPMAVVVSWYINENRELKAENKRLRESNEAMTRRLDHIDEGI